MNTFPVSKLTLTAACAVMGLSALSAAHAETIDFNTLTGANGSAFTTYTEGNFTVTNLTGQYLVAMYYGDPIPDLFSGSGDTDFAPLATASASVTITRDIGTYFTFSSADLAAFEGSGSYEFIGYLNGTKVFDQTGSVSGVFSTFADNFSTATISRLVIAESGPDYNLDNIVVAGAVAPTTTPEPSSLMLLGTGLAACAGAIRRRIKA